MHRNTHRIFTGEPLFNLIFAERLFNIDIELFPLFLNIEKKVSSFDN